VIDAGLTWIGPHPKVIRQMGDKIRAKKIAATAGVPVIPGITNVKEETQIIKWMKDEEVSFPIIIKASAGGGGKGMVKVEEKNQIGPALHQARSEAAKSFGDTTLLVEKYIEHGRHIEVQIIADRHGNVLHLFERECTIQRRNQKLIEEAPSPSLSPDLRQEFVFPLSVSCGKLIIPQLEPLNLFLTPGQKNTISWR
jgi:acetyl-CoA carboxylase biotin carboxylase subunit/propionyl-CoA carboxylase alpha chain